MAARRFAASFGRVACARRRGFAQRPLAMIGRWPSSRASSVHRIDRTVDVEPRTRRSALGSKNASDVLARPGLWTLTWLRTTARSSPKNVDDRAAVALSHLDSRAHAPPNAHGSACGCPQRRTGPTAVLIDSGWQADREDEPGRSSRTMRRSEWLKRRSETIMPPPGGARHGAGREPRERPRACGRARPRSRCGDRRGSRPG